MYSDQLSLNGDTYTSTTEGIQLYDRTGLVGPRGGTQFHVAAVNNSEPLTITFRSEVITRSGQKRRRSNVRFDTNRLDTEGELNNCNVNITADNPVGSGLADSEMLASIGRAVAFLAVEANLIKFLAGEG
eukprot:NODE_691_length_744_cov_92.382734_g626_i0.p1 GENE.NODE_691_length_744_cov_92.382734_g626_i0~~NODE_691_length_744_cov_92.382734_g626_i0.p1  ORF type:complete len:130 (-),score=6.62 NODE_691_length_744_cov_92.382734_g626_i0:287-676(-)